jgi:hypothetical protein
MNIKDSIQCETGWNKIIYSCHSELMAIDPLYRPLQIKEKFGGLRYYFSTEIKDQNLVQKMYEVAFKYENLSFQTCEKCGESFARPYRTKSGWIKTHCPKHKKENR